MGLMDSIKKLYSVVDDEEAEDEVAVDEEFDAEPGNEPKKRFGFSKFESKSKSNEEYYGDMKSEFIVVKPEKFDESLQIGTYLLEKKTVVLNLEATGKEQARRIVDFLTGVAFALSGQIKKVALATYLIIPNNAEISGVDADPGETGGMYF